MVLREPSLDKVDTKISKSCINNCQRNMKEKKGNTYMLEFELKAIRLSETGGKSDAQIERDRGTSPAYISCWKQKSAEDEESTFPDHRRRSPKTAILVFPLAAPSVLSLASKLATTLSSIATHTVLVSGGIPGNSLWPNNIQIHDIGLRLHYLRQKKPVWFSAMLWIGKALIAQARLAKEIFRLRNQVDVIICFIGIHYQLPILVAKLLGKNVMCTSLGLQSLKAKLNYGGVVGTLTDLLSRFNFTLSQAILVDSLRLGTHDTLVPFRSKLRNGALFFEGIDHFQAWPAVDERENLVGFIGRLTAEKGIMEFVRAIPLALEKQSNLRFLIIGAGILDEALEMAIHGQPWSSQVTWLGWVEHERIPEYLNRLKLVVVPTHEDGLPNRILEAMGCGTPVLATGVGGIPDLVTDGETGFLLRDNSPETLAESIVRVVNNPRLEIVAQRAWALVKRNYSQDAASQRYQAIMSAMVGRHTKR